MRTSTVSNNSLTARCGGNVGSRSNRLGKRVGVRRQRVVQGAASKEFSCRLRHLKWKSPTSLVGKDRGFSTLHC